VHVCALSGISPYGHTHKLCNLELPTVCPLALSVNEFWDIYCPVCRFDGDGYDAFDLFHSMSTHLQSSFEFCEALLLDYPF
jgi:hypothetical protein